MFDVVSTDFALLMTSIIVVASLLHMQWRHVEKRPLLVGVSVGLAFGPLCYVIALRLGNTGVAGLLSVWLVAILLCVLVTVLMARVKAGSNSAT